MFADKPKTLYDTLNDAALNIADTTLDLLFHDIKKPLTDALFWSYYTQLVIIPESIQNVPNLLKNESLDINYDGCNLTYVSDFGVLNLRNPYCQPPPPPPPPQGATPLKNWIACKDGTIRKPVYLTPQDYSLFDNNGIIKSYHYNAGTPINTVSIDQKASNLWLFNKAFTDLQNAPLAYRNLSFELLAGTWVTTVNQYMGIGKFDLENNLISIDRTIPVRYRNRQFRIYGETFLDGIWTPYAGNVGSPYVECEFIALPCDPKIEPPPPPKDKDCDCMDCCPNVGNLEALLKLILKRIGTLPVQVPTSFLTKKGVQPAQVKSVASLTDFIAWFVERFDETIGEFEITIDVDDADLTKEGKQTATVRLPNLAESIAEMFSLMLHSNINNELILNIVNRTLIESGQIKQSEFKNFSAVNSIIDYLGFHTNSSTEKMPLTFTPGKLSFDKLLKETEIDVSVLTYTQKETLAATLQPLLQAAAIIRAVHYKRTPGNQQQVTNVIKEDLAKLLGENGNLSDQIKTFISNMDKIYDGINSKP